MSGVLISNIKWISNCPLLMTYQSHIPQKITILMIFDAVH